MKEAGNVIFHDCCAVVAAVGVHGRCAARTDGPPSFCLLAPVGCPPPKEQQAACDEGGAGLAVSKTCFISKTSHHAEHRVNPHGFGFKRDDKASVQPDSRQSRMPVKGGGRLASYPSKSENVGVSHTFNCV